MDINELKLIISNLIKNQDPDKINSIEQKEENYDSIIKKWKEYNKNKDQIDKSWVKIFDQFDKWKKNGIVKLFNSSKEETILGIVYYENDSYHFQINSKQLKDIFNVLQDEIIILTYLFRN